MITRLLRLFTDTGGACYGPAIDTITSTGTAIGAALAATAIASGDTFQIKNTAGTAKAWLLNAWVKNQAAGMVRIRSPKFHDNVDAIRSRVQSGLVDPVLPWGAAQQLFPQDVEIVELAGSAVGGQIEDVVQQIYYEDLPGQAARFIDDAALQSRRQNVLGLRLAITCGAAAGYGGSRAINGDVDLLKANTDYAIVGMVGDLRVAAITVRGPDTGNLRIAVPGEISKNHVYAEYFRRLSNTFKLPLIPVINSANKGATFIETVSDQAAGTCNVTVLLAELK